MLVVIGLRCSCVVLVAVPFVLAVPECRAGLCVVYIFGGRTTIVLRVGLCIVPLPDQEDAYSLAEEPENGAGEEGNILKCRKC